MHRESLAEETLPDGGAFGMVSAHVDRTSRPGPEPRRLPPAERLGRLTRGVMIGMAVALATVLGIARWLEPNPRGFGTHTQLGLSPCAFLVMTGHPCPSCGMTTAFAWTARGRPDRAWRANPAGSLIAPTCALFVPWLIVGAVRGRPWGTKTLDGPLIAAVVAAVGLSLGAWTIRLLYWRVFG